MRSIICFFFILAASLSFGQEDVVMEDSLLLVEDSVEIILLFDSLPGFSYFNPSEIINHNSRITAFQANTNSKNIYFFAIIVFSLLLSMVYINSREMVKSSVKSLTSVQNTIQFSRTEKQSNGIYFGFYLILFVLGLAMTAHYVFGEMYGLHYTFLKIVLFVVLVFSLDYSASYLYLLFTTNDKSVDMVQTVILTYPVLLSFVLWPALFFVILAALPTGKLFLFIFFFVLGIIFVLKEIRTLQVLRIEKIDIFSFHFFAYLCTFKFLPLFVMAKIFF
jgi:hypothetical protein